jgi:hypothetical protein
MAIYGALGEGWSYANGSRNGEFFFRGQASVSSAASVTITIPLPIRLALFPQATLVKNTAPSAAVIVSVGAPSGNTFIIYGWQFTSTANPTLIAATGSWVVNWTCFGNLTGTTPIENQP